MEYTIKDLAKKWGVDRSTAYRRVKKLKYPIETRMVEVLQKKGVIFVTVAE